MWAPLGEQDDEAEIATVPQSTIECQHVERYSTVIDHSS